jgi:excisionase family DNA binding protein
MSRPLHVSDCARCDELELFQINEAAELLRIGVRTLRRLIGRNELKTVRIRRRVLIRKSAIVEYLDRTEQ